MLFFMRRLTLTVTTAVLITLSLIFIVSSALYRPESQNYFYNMLILHTTNKNISPRKISENFYMTKLWSSRKGDFVVDRLTTQFENTEKKVEFFRHYWLLQRDLRVNYDMIQLPCKHNMTWSSHYQYRTAGTVTSVKYSHVILDIQPVGQYSRAIIHTFSIINTRKYIGGDTWRIHVHGETSVSVSVVDNMDGSYEAFFLLMEPGVYYMTLYLDYTLCDGYKDPPPDWFKLGNTQGKHQPPHALPGHYQAKPFLEDEFRGNLTFKVKREIGYDNLMKNIKYLQYKKSNCFMKDGFGRWLNDRLWKEYITEPLKSRMNKPHVKAKGKFWILGDSVGDFLYKSITQTPLCQNLFASCNRTYYWSYKLSGANLTQAKNMDDDEDFSIDRVIFELKETMNKLDENSVLLLNYGLHYAMGISFERFKEMMIRVAQLIITERHNGFKGKVIWKTTTALYKWRYGHRNTSARHNAERRFLTSQRVELFNAFSTSQMCEADIDVIDVYQMTVSYPKGTRLLWDAVHFSPVVFKSVEDYLYDFFKNS